MLNKLKYFKIFILGMIIFSTLGFKIQKDKNVNTYKLTILSLSEKTEIFDLKIISKNESNSKDDILELTNIKTPFNKILPFGEYEILITSNGKNESIESKIQGFDNGVEKGSAVGSFKNTILKVSPTGFYEARKK